MDNHLPPPPSPAPLRPMWRAARPSMTCNDIIVHTPGGHGFPFRKARGRHWHWHWQRAAWQGALGTATPRWVLWPYNVQNSSPRVSGGGCCVRMCDGCILLGIHATVWRVEIESALGCAGARLHGEDSNGNSMENNLSGLPSGAGLICVCLM